MSTTLNIIYKINSQIKCYATDLKYKTILEFSQNAFYLFSLIYNILKSIK